jgi:hypothetical protein
LPPPSASPTVDLGPSAAIIRRAEKRDVPAIVDLLAADQLGATRDGVRTAEDLAAYQRAFAAIDGDRSHLLVVMEADAEVVATLQLSFLLGRPRPRSQ